MLKYSLLFALYCLLICCSGKYSGEFALQPPPGSAYQLTVTTEDLRSDETDTLPFTSETLTFTLLPNQKKDSLCNLLFIVKKIETQQPATETIPMKNGGFMVQATGAMQTLSTGSVSDTAGQDWYRIVPRIVDDSVRLYINRVGEVRYFFGYEKIKRKIVAATGDDPRNISPLVRRYVGEDPMTDLVNQLFFYLPGRKIQPGDSWVKNTVMIEKTPVKYSNLITVKDIKNDTVQMTVKSIVSSRLGQGGKLILEGELTGTINASHSTGLLIDLELEENSVVHTDNYDRRIVRRLRATLH
jgi:hypothetical protein